MRSGNRTITFTHTGRATVVARRIRALAVAVVASILALNVVVSEAQTATGPARTSLATTANQTGIPTGHVFNIIDWEGGRLPALYERSEQLPMTLDDILALNAADFADSIVVKMVQERRCACDASVQSLVKLKQNGVSQTILQAISLHALPPNRQVDLTIQLDFEGLGGQRQISTQARAGYLYLIIPDGDRDRVFFGNLRELLAGRGAPDTLPDDTDLLLRKNVRRLSFVARVPLKTHGAKRAVVFTSTRPDIYTVSDIPEADRQGAIEFVFDYPASSLRQDCSLQVLHRQDAMLADKWHLERSHFECEWE